MDNNNMSHSCLATQTLNKDHNDVFNNELKSHQARRHKSFIFLVHLKRKQSQKPEVSA